jgi:ferredoxin
MPVSLHVDGRAVTVEGGSTLVAAAREAGVVVPTMCHVDGVEPAVSCMVCVVRDLRTGRMLPACSTVAAERMNIDASSAHVQAARRMAVELQLDRHAGDCVAPCELACPCRIPMPKVLRALRNGDLRAAHLLVAACCALPRASARACMAFCESACRRKALDHPLGLCELHRQAADVDVPPPEPVLAVVPWRIALADASAAALACAHRLRQCGHAVTVAAPPNPGNLPSAPFQADLKELRSMGIVFAEAESEIDVASFDLVVGADDFPEHQESHPVVRALASGRATADRLLRRLAGLPEVLPRQRSCMAGKMTPEELSALRPETDDARGDAWRCLHCDCRAADDCRLRQAADLLGAWRIPAPARPEIVPDYSHPTVVHEPHKCIACGACLRIARQAGEPVGLSWHGRGADVRVAPPLGRTWTEALTLSAAACVRACPTAALAWKIDARAPAGVPFDHATADTPSQVR